VQESDLHRADGRRASDIAFGTELERLGALQLCASVFRHRAEPIDGDSSGRKAPPGSRTRFYSAAGTVGEPNFLGGLLFPLIGLLQLESFFCLGEAKLLLERGQVTIPIA
jgi:hypothetical protein